jgi:hypothetical protein
MDDKLESSKCSNTIMRFEVEYSKTKFILFGDINNHNTIYIKSGNASLELLGAYPLEAIEISVSSWISFVIQLCTDLLQGSHHWAISFAFPSPENDEAVTRLVLVWEGIASNSDVSRVKAALDRNAIDISASVLRADFSRA